MIQKIFQLRVCDDTVFKNRERPCILYQIKRCSGPCVGFVKESEYKNSVDDAIKFVSGKSRDIQKNLSKQMEEASKKLDFEKASIFIFLNKVYFFKCRINKFKSFIKFFF